MFSVVEPESFENAWKEVRSFKHHRKRTTQHNLLYLIKKWYPELQQIFPRSHKVFVGNKIDLRETSEYTARVGENAPVSYDKVPKN